MRDWALPGLLGLSWILFVLAISYSRRSRLGSLQGIAALIVVTGAVLLAMWGEILLGAGLLTLGIIGFVVAQRRRNKRAAPTLVELALLAEYLAQQIFGGSNLGQALRQAGRDAAGTPPTLPLPMLGPSLTRQSRIMATGVSEAQVLLELGEQFDEPTARSFFTFLASLAQHITQAGLAEALESMSERVRTYQELDKSFQSRLALARTTRYVMLLLVPGLLYMITFHSPLMEGGLLSSPTGVLLLAFDSLMLVLAVVVGNLMSRLPSLEF